MSVYYFFLIQNELFFTCYDGEGMLTFKFATRVFSIYIGWKRNEQYESHKNSVSMLQ
jgi:hypothetical protein